MGSEKTLAVFSAKPYDKKFLEEANANKAADPVQVNIVYHSASLSESTADLAKGATAVCAFVNDDVSEPVIAKLKENGVEAVLMRCAGFNNVNLEAAASNEIFVANVPAYSPEAVGEFAVALVQTLNRHTHRAYNRVREGNFALDGLLGKTLYKRTVGVVGTGRIGVSFARIMHGFGCRILAFDPFKNDELKKYGSYVDELEELLAESDIVSLHCPLMESTKHLINEETLGKMKKGAMLVNTSRGGLIDTRAVIGALKSGRLGSLGLDVYEGEGALFYNDHSLEVIQDDDLMRLMTFPNVLVCGHQAFFTEEALHEISTSTLRNLKEYLTGGECKNELTKKGDKRIKRVDSHPVRTV